MTTPASAKRVAMACLVGTSIEWYDFFIYGTASALVPEAVLPFLRPRGRDAARPHRAPDGHGHHAHRPAADVRLGRRGRQRHRLAGRPNEPRPPTAKTV